MCFTIKQYPEVAVSCSHTIEIFSGKKNKTKYKASNSKAYMVVVAKKRQIDETVLH